MLDLILSWIELPITCLLGLNGFEILSNSLLTLEATFIIYADKIYIHWLLYLCATYTIKIEIQYFWPKENYCPESFILIAKRCECKKGVSFVVYWNRFFWPKIFYLSISFRIYTKPYTKYNHISLWRIFIFFFFFVRKIKCKGIKVQ